MAIHDLNVNQDSTIASNTGTTATNTTTIATSNASIDTNIGAKADAIAASPGTNSSVIALLKGLWTDFGLSSSAVASSDTGTFNLIQLIKRGLQTLTTIATNTAQSGSSTTATTTTVAASTSSASVLASNASRKSFWIYNTGAATVTISYAATATAAAQVFPLPSGFALNESDYTGAVSCITSSGTASLQVTSLT